QLNLMTAGHGIAHSEESTPDRPQVLHGAQLWVALPEDQRDVPAHFEHHADLPRRTEGGVTVTVIVGELDGAASPARAYTGLFGAEVAFTGAAAAGVPLDPDFEYGA